MKWNDLAPETASVLSRAMSDAGIYGRGKVQPEHLLLEIARQVDGEAAGILRRLGVDLEAIDQQLWTELPRGKFRRGHTEPTITRPAERVLAHARREARADGSGTVGTRHLQLGMLSEIGTTAASMLADVGVTEEQVRRMLDEWYTDSNSRQYAGGMETNG